MYSQSSATTRRSSRGVKAKRVQRRFGTIKAVEVADPAAQSARFGRSGCGPIEFAGVTTLAKLAAHIELLLARKSPQIAVQTAQAGKALPLVAG